MKYKLSEIVEINPKEKITKGTYAKKVTMDKLVPYSRDILSYEFEEYNGGTKFRNGDTIMARITPCLENGKIAQVKFLDEDEVGFGSTEYIVFRSKENIDKNYLYYLITSSKIKEPAIQSMVGSSGRQRVQTDVIKSLEIDIPPLEVQIKIAYILSTIDDKIELNNKMNENLEQQAMTIYHYMFVENRKDEWRAGTVNDLGKSIICGKTPSTKIKENYGNDIPFITIPDMHHQIYIVNTDRMLSKVGAETQINKILDKNSVCVSCIGTPGLVSLVARESQTNQQINSIIPKENYSPYFIYLMMKSFSDKIYKFGQSGSTMPNLNKTQFEKLEVVIPPIEEMNLFDNTVSSFFEKILNNQLENQQLITLRDTLLPRLMSGELDVSNIEI